MNGPHQPGILHTPGFAHYSVAWSPFHPTRLALASSANFGLVGNGRLHLVSAKPNPGGPSSLNLDKQYETQDGLYDVAWSEIHENQLVTGSGDGSIRLWDVMLNDLPIRAWQEHTREVFSVDWSNLKKDTFASASWEGTVKLWTPDRARSIATLKAHQACVYQALFSPHQPDLLSTCSTDGTVKIFDLRAPSYVNTGPNANTFTSPVSAAVLTIPASGTEVLTIDWNKYRSMVLASAGVDKSVKIWDCRMINTGEVGQVGGICETQLLGHEYAVRKVQWSPHRPDVLATASYDMTSRVWTTTPTPGRPQLLHIHDPHTEFVVGCSWSLYDEGILATCGWDESNRSSFAAAEHNSYSNLVMDAEDFLSDSLQTLYDYQPITLTTTGAPFSYTFKLPSISNKSSGDVHQPITISLKTPDTDAANWDLHASSIWASSVYLSDHIYDLDLESHIHLSSREDPVRVLELGASAGLPSILIAKLYFDVRVTSTDYPDKLLIQTLAENVESNNASDRCKVLPFGWGTDPSPILHENRKFDVIMAADTLWNPELHTIFTHALKSTLKRTTTSRAHLVVGLHTGRYTIDSFLRKVLENGFEVQSIEERERLGSSKRNWQVFREAEDDKERRRWVIWIQLKWSESEVELYRSSTS
ncbi:Peroxisomal targeting signal 2 receptor [Psilocybe cubensis]|uniref:Peroxin-7 n=2 Tax=Psilocybe cubensis TaxID=181762 RepID=A0A8H8CIW8_PSICU|nr:Peroxisomal targeting signal 2 receptor [Psilocybe cubensis]KAH9479405.1 Peroxisomal targeting signal 2 receptor [Psilocybe cubensis]